MTASTPSPRQATPSPVLDVRRVEHAILLMHFDDVWVTRILDGGALGLSPDERALFDGVDRRGFHADGERAARAAGVVIEELPVAVAVAGVPRLLSFFRDDAFARVIVHGTPLVVAAAAWLDNVPARIEGAVARARRRKRLPTGDVVVAAHVASAVAPEDAVERWARARADLGTDVVAAVAGGRRVPWAAAAEHGDAGVLVNGDPASPAVARCALPLARLIARLGEGVDVPAFRAIARDEGCDDDVEADALLADLVADGLLVRR